ncbi:MAG: hypothetical protein AAF170_04260 [Bacteroidota bacterium]
MATPYKFDNLPLGSCRVATFDPATAASDKFFRGLEGEVMIQLETELSAARPNAAGGQVLDGSTYEFAGQALITLPLPHGMGETGQLLFPTLTAYGAEDVVGVKPTGAKLASTWLCILPDIAEQRDGTAVGTHIFARVIPAQKQHLVKFGNPGNRGSQPDAAQFVTTFEPDAAHEELQKGLVYCTPNAAVLTELGWAFVPEAPA